MMEGGKEGREIWRKMGVVEREGVRYMWVVDWKWAWLGWVID